MNRVELHPVGRDVDDTARLLDGSEGQRLLDLVARLSPNAPLQQAPDDLILTLQL